MRKFSGLIVCGLIVWTLNSGLRDAVANDVSIHHRGTDAVPIERNPPRYPTAAVYRWIEGWVLISFVVDTDGSTRDVEILDSSIDGVFDKSSLSAAKSWTYKAATLNGQPVVQAKTRVRLTYVFEESDGGATQDFRRYYQQAAKAINEKDFEKAEKIFDKLDRRKQKLLAEVGYLDLLKGHYWAAKKVEWRALHFYERSLIVADHFPEVSTYKFLLKQLFYLSVRQNRLYDALKHYDKLAEIEGDFTPEDPTRKLAEQVQAFLNGPEPFASQGKVNKVCIECQENQPFWRHSLYRSRFLIDQIEGNVTDFKLLCGFQYITIAFDRDMRWDIEDDWGQCDIHVYGDVGTTFRLVELQGTGKD